MIDIILVSSSEVLFLVIAVGNALDPETNFSVTLWSDDITNV